MAMPSGSVRRGVIAIILAFFGGIGNGCATVAQRSDAVAATGPAPPVVDASVAQSMLHVVIDHALAAAITGLECPADHAAILAWFGRALRARAFADAALASFARVKGLRPDDARAWLDYARAAFTKGDLEDSIGAARTALVLQPELEAARLLLGRSLRRRAAEDRTAAGGADSFEPQAQVGAIRGTGR